MNQVAVDVVSSPGCRPCEALEAYWQTVAKDWPNVVYKKYDITTSEGAELAQKYMVMSSPGIIINNELFSTGGFNQEPFIAKLKQLSA